MHCNSLIPLTGILGKINVIATLPSCAVNHVQWQLVVYHFFRYNIEKN
jgi:hypothetical protein